MTDQVGDAYEAFDDIVATSKALDIMVDFREDLDKVGDACEAHNEVNNFEVTP